jgi:hypothetical protein
MPHPVCFGGSDIAPYRPLRFNAEGRRRFLRKALAFHLAKVPGDPSALQIRLARTASNLAYALFQAERIEADDPLRGADHAARHAQRLLKILAEYDRTLRPPPPPPKRPPTIAEIIARAQRQGREVAT